MHGGRLIEVDGVKVPVGSAVRTVASTTKLVLVLLDPDVYLAEAGYRERRRAGAPAVNNLQAFSRSGTKIWDAEMPEAVDYYYELVNSEPIEALSFSGYRCVINAADGRIEAKQYLK